MYIYLTKINKMHIWIKNFSQSDTQLFEESKEMFVDLNSKCSMLSVYERCTKERAHDA